MAQKRAIVGFAVGTMIMLTNHTFTCTGPGIFLRFMKSLNYMKDQVILAKTLVSPYWKLELGSKYITSQDDDPKHSSMSTKKWPKK